MVTSAREIPGIALPTPPDTPMDTIYVSAYPEGYDFSAIPEDSGELSLPEEYQVPNWFANGTRMGISTVDPESRWTLRGEIVRRREGGEDSSANNGSENASERERVRTGEGDGAEAENRNEAAGETSNNGERGLRLSDWMGMLPPSGSGEVPPNNGEWGLPDWMEMLPRSDSGERLYPVQRHPNQNPTTVDDRNGHGGAGARYQHQITLVNGLTVTSFGPPSPVSEREEESDESEAPEALPSSGGDETVPTVGGRDRDGMDDDPSTPRLPTRISAPTPRRREEIHILDSGGNTARVVPPSNSGDNHDTGDTVLELGRQVEASPLPLPVPLPSGITGAEGAEREGDEAPGMQGLWGFDNSAAVIDRMSEATTTAAGVILPDAVPAPDAMSITYSFPGGLQGGEVAYVIPGGQNEGAIYPPHNPLRDVALEPTHYEEYEGGVEENPDPDGEYFFDPPLSFFFPPVVRQGVDGQEEDEDAGKDGERDTDRRGRGSRVLVSGGFNR